MLNNLNFNIPTAQPSKLKAQPTKTEPTKINPQTVKTQPKPQPPKPYVTHRISTNNSFAVLDDLDLGEDSPHDYSQHQLNFESNIPYSQGSDFFDYQLNGCG